MLYFCAKADYNIKKAIIRDYLLVATWFRMTAISCMSTRDPYPFEKYQNDDNFQGKESIKVSFLQGSDTKNSLTSGLVN